MLSEVVWQDFSKWKAKEQIDFFWMIGTAEFVIIPDQVVKKKVFLNHNFAEHYFSVVGIYRRQGRPIGCSQ